MVSWVCFSKIFVSKIKSMLYIRIFFLNLPFDLSSIVVSLIVEWGSLQVENVLVFDKNVDDWSVVSCCELVNVFTIGLLSNSWMIVLPKNSL